MFPPKTQWPIVLFACSLLSAGCVDPAPMNASLPSQRFAAATPEPPMHAASSVAAAARGQDAAADWQPAGSGQDSPTRKVIAQAPSAPPPLPRVERGEIDPAAKLRDLYQQAATRYAGMDSYIARLRRREQVHGKDQPEELILFKFRKEPWSVYFKWLGNTGKGREVVYVKGQHGNMLHTLLAAGDMPLAPAGKRMALPPDNVFVKSASRHAITEAGIGVIIEQCGRALEAQKNGQNSFGSLTYRGLMKRPEYPHPLETVEQQIPARLESSLPQGGRRWIFFDPTSGLPVLLITHDEKGHEVEYYCYDLLQYPVKLDNADFDPDRLWGSRGK
jgi:Protein of unknown function (DUF1571)